MPRRDPVLSTPLWGCPSCRHYFDEDAMLHQCCDFEEDDCPDNESTLEWARLWVRIAATGRCHAHFDHIYSGKLTLDLHTYDLDGTSTETDVERLEYQCGECEQSFLAPVDLRNTGHRFPDAIALRAVEIG